MKNTSSVSPVTTNWSNFGIYKQIPANTETVRKAGAVYVVLPGGKRVLARTKSTRASLRKALSDMRVKKPVVVEPKVTYRVRLVKARIKTAGGKTLNRVCKVKGSNGVQKLFVTKKAAMAWIKKQK